MNTNDDTVTLRMSAADYRKLKRAIAAIDNLPERYLFAAAGLDRSDLDELDHDNGFEVHVAREYQKLDRAMGFVGRIITTSRVRRGRSTCPTCSAPMTTGATR